MGGDYDFCDLTCIGCPEGDATCCYPDDYVWSLTYTSEDEPAYTSTQCSALAEDNDNVQTALWTRKEFSCSYPGLRGAAPTTEQKAAVGCKDSESTTDSESDEGNDFCDLIVPGTILVFLSFGCLLAISIVACCIACCGKADSDDKEDSGVVAIER